jgi:hypothetical protein
MPLRKHAASCVTFSLESVSYYYVLIKSKINNIAYIMSFIILYVTYSQLKI